LSPVDLVLVRALRNREQRDATGYYVIEGVRFLIAAADANADFVGLVVCKRLLTSVVGRMIVRRLKRSGVPLLAVSDSEYASVSRLEEGTGRGVVAIVRQSFRRARAIRSGELWLAVEAVRSPGNLGTLLRTCLAVGARGVFVIGNTDVHDPGCVRATMGALPALDLVRVAPHELIELVRRSNASLIGVSPDGARPYWDHRYRPATVLLVGSERTGISRELRSACDALVRIPMVGKLDSLNVAVAGSLVLYEVFAQRLDLRWRAGESDAGN